jgi:hypothetical protein
VSVAKASGVILVMPADHAVGVDGDLWRAFDADARKHFETNMAAYCDLHSGKRGRSVIIVDQMAGRVIELYSEAFNLF